MADQYVVELAVMVDAASRQRERIDAIKKQHVLCSSRMIVERYLFE